MSYTSTLPSFPTNIIIAQSATWFSTLDLNILLSVVSSVYFPISDARSSAYDTITKTIFTVPFSYVPPSRFVSPGAYITTLDPTLARIISQLLNALSYKDRLFEKTNIGNTTVSASSNTPQYLIALNSFTAARLELVNYVSDYRNYYDRNRFETTYSLLWS